MQFSEQFILVLDELCKRFGLVIDWTAQNVMPYLQDLSSRVISYEIAKNILFILLLPAAVIATREILKRVTRYANEWDKEHNHTTTEYDLVHCIGCVVVGVLSILAASSVLDIIKCVFLPEMVIYGYIKPLL